MNKNDLINKTIYSQRLAGMLMQKGFVLVGMEKNEKSQSGRNVFFFKNSPELEAAIYEYVTANK